MLLRRLGPAAVGLVLINCGCWAQQHVISTVAGGGLPPSGVPALSTGIEVPIAAAADAFGNLFISTRDNWVFKVDQAGVLTRVAGTGTAGYSGDDGLAVNTQLN